MTAAEKQEMLTELASGGKTLLTALNHLQEAQAAIHPAPGRWSVLDVLEHLVLVEDHLFGQILAARDTVEPVGSEARERKIRARAPDRSRPVAAPPMAIPAGRFATVGEAARAFVISRERTLRFVQGSKEDLRAKVATHPVIGPANCYEMLLMMAAHPFRHAAQIGEIRDALTARRIATRAGTTLPTD
jgi:uncharacterized damage-inducible protein DinB